jgi:hypothetical protein
VIALLDAYDVWMPEYLASSLAMFDESGPEAAAVTSGYIVQPEGISSEGLWRRRRFKEGIQRITPDMSSRDRVPALGGILLQELLPVWGRCRVLFEVAFE